VGEPKNESWGTERHELSGIKSYQIEKGVHPIHRKKEKQRRKTISPEKKSNGAETAPPNDKRLVNRDRGQYVLSLGSWKG